MNDKVRIRGRSKLSQAKSRHDLSQVVSQLREKEREIERERKSSTLSRVKDIARLQRKGGEKRISDKREDKP